MQLDRNAWMLNVHAIFTINYLLEVNLDHPNKIFIGPIPSLLSRQNSSEICWKYTSKDTYTANNAFFVQSIELQ